MGFLAMNIYEASTSTKKASKTTTNLTFSEYSKSPPLLTKPHSDPPKRKFAPSFTNSDLNIIPRDNGSKAYNQVRKRKKFQKKDKGKSLLKYGLNDEDEEDIKTKKLEDLIFPISKKSATDSTQSSPPI